MPPQQQTGMEKAEMMTMLKHTKEKPVHCAIGVGKDQAVGLLLMHKMTAPKMLEKQLLDSIPGARNTRWGTAAVDWENDPKLVKLFLNKPVTSMARRLVKTLKGTGFSKVQIMTEDGTPVEGAVDEEPETATEPGADGAAPAAEAAASQETADAPPPPPPPPPEEAPAQDSGALSRRLAALAPRIPQAAGDDAARKEELSKLFRMATTYIKTNGLAYAANYIGQLERALDSAGQGAAAAAPPPPPPPPEEAPAQDAAALSRRLAALAPRIQQAAGDAARKEELSKLFRMATTYIKTNGLAYAANYIGQLERALGAAAAAPPPPPPPPTTGGAPDAARAGGQETGKYSKSGEIWLATRAKVGAELDKLRAAIVAAYQGEPFVSEIEAKFRDRTTPIMQTLDTRLSDALAGVDKATDPAQRGQLIMQANKVLGEYQAFAAGGSLANLDDNPFVPVSVQATISGTLSQLAKVLQ